MRRLSHPFKAVWLWLAVLLIDPGHTLYARAEILSLEPDEFYEYVQTGEALIIDVRNTVGWNLGHIPNATYFLNFARFLYVTPADEINATLQHTGIFDCLERCTTIIYCRSSRAARRSLDLLYQKAGFITAKLYNGHGTGNWTDAGYPLVREPSYEPPCLRDDIDMEDMCPTTRNENSMEGQVEEIISFPTMSPTPEPTLDPTLGTEPAVLEEKVAVESKCGGSVTGEGDRGGSAGTSKDCSRQGGGGRKRIRGL